MVSYRVPAVKCVRLFQDCTYRKVACVGDEAIRFRWVRKRKEGGCGKGSYKGVIRLLLCRCPVKRVVFLSEVEQGSCYGGVIFDKATVEVAKSKKSLDLLDVVRNRPVRDSREFLWIHRDMTIRNDKAQIFNSSFHEGAFLGSEIKIPFPESSSDFMSKGWKLCQGFVKNEDVV